MSESKRAGTWAETMVVNWLQLHGYPWAERRALQGANDKGDIAGVDGRVIEVKNEKRIDLPGYLKELEAEKANAEADEGAVVIRRRGTQDVGQWYAVMTVEDLVKLWKRAG